MGDFLGGIIEAIKGALANIDLTAIIEGVKEFLAGLGA